MASATVRFEQAVYGSFPFWGRGYALLAQSPGCRAEWIVAFRAACQQIGERPRGASEAPFLFAMRLGRGGPWLVVGVSGQGRDDRGRPGALAFHALFLRPRDARKISWNPFLLTEALRSEWSIDVGELPSGKLAVEAADTPPLDIRARRIALALGRGRRVAIESDAPIDAPASAVWPALPPRIRRRASLATWAFANGNRFDLVALPRLAGIALDPSYVIEADLAEEPGVRPPRPWRRLALVGVLIAALAGMTGLALALRPRATPTAPVGIAPPDRAAYLPDRTTADDRRRVAEGLLDLADRCGLAASDLDGDPAALMARLSDRLRYRGPLLTPEGLARLDALPPADRRRFLGWDAHIRHFLPDRPLPPDFAAGPLRQQLDTLAWSFQFGPFRGPVAEIPDALAEALAVEGPIRAPADATLAAYAQFLGRLPRR